jgi:hypothetical protein
LITFVLVWFTYFIGETLAAKIGSMRFHFARVWRAPRPRIAHPDDAEPRPFLGKDLIVGMRGDRGRFLDRVKSPEWQSCFNAFVKMLFVIFAEDHR